MNILNSPKNATIAEDLPSSRGAALSTAEHSPLTTRGPRASRLRRPASRSLALLFMVLSSIGLSVATSAHEAAAAPLSTANVCFQQQGGGAYTGPTQMQVYVNGRWQSLVTMAGTTSGCRTSAVLAYNYTRFVVSYSYGPSSWWSQTNWSYIYPGTHTTYGTYLVNWTVR